MINSLQYQSVAKCMSIYLHLDFMFADLKVTHLKWTQSEDAESLIVGTKYISGCFLETWRLVEKATPIHSHFKHMFQTPNKTEVFKAMVSRLLLIVENKLPLIKYLLIYQVWNHQSNYQYTSNIVDICSSKFQYGSNNYLFISMADNSIHLLNRDTLKRVCMLVTFATQFFLHSSQ